MSLVSGIMAGLTVSIRPLWGLGASERFGLRSLVWFRVSGLGLKVEGLGV